ncbi:hypothetical protein [Pseudonocardia sp. TRM90224]|uniref:hypothetical protein n=1 Tax=Pseudonocardia sp. TRM90224 TaxID=2812678 RepID=UPI001E60A2E2|nr:hypothetical protein [Pseudonocardia sp. TRM90224]
MWAFLSSRLRRWLILAVVVPAVGWLLGKAGDVIEARRGPSGLTRFLQTVSGWLVPGLARGPSERTPADPTGVRDPGAPAR